MDRVSQIVARSPRHLAPKGNDLTPHSWYLGYSFQRAHSSYDSKGNRKFEWARKFTSRRPTDSGRLTEGHEFRALIGSPAGVDIEWTA